MNVRSLISRVPIDAIIKEHLRLKESGVRYLRGVEHDSLVVDLKTNRFYWNSISISGDALTWLTKIVGLSYSEALGELQKHSGLPFTNIIENLYKPSPIYPPLMRSFYELGRHYREYWYRRGFTDASIDHFKLGYTGKAFVIPIVVNNTLVDFQCRIGEGANKRVWKWSKGSLPHPFNATGKKGSYIFMAEGPPDAIILHQLGLPVISQDCGPNWRAVWNKHIIGYNQVYIIYDNDEAGMIGAKRTARKLLNRGYILCWPDYFDSKFDINKAYLTLGEQKTKTLILEAMLPLAVHSSEIKNLSEVKRKVGTVARRLGIL